MRKCIGRKFLHSWDPWRLQGFKTYASGYSFNKKERTILAQTCWRCGWVRTKEIKGYLSNGE